MSKCGRCKQAFYCDVECQVGSCQLAGRPALLWRLGHVLSLSLASCSTASHSIRSTLGGNEPPRSDQLREQALTACSYMQGWFDAEEEGKTQEDCVRCGRGSCQGLEFVSGTPSAKFGIWQRSGKQSAVWVSDFRFPQQQGTPH